MAFAIRSADADDIPNIARVFHEVFDDDSVVRYCFKDIPEESWKTLDLLQLGDRYKQGGGRMWMMIDTSTRQIVGFTYWEYPRKARDIQQVEDDSGKSIRRPWWKIEGANLDLCRSLYGRLDELKSKYRDSENDFYVQILGILPAYQRRGLGTLLLEKGLKDADAAGARTYIEASPKGLGLYLKLGWEKVDEVPIPMDLRKHGEDDVATEVLLIREAQTEPSLAMT